MQTTLREYIESFQAELSPLLFKVVCAVTLWRHFSIPFLFVRQDIKDKAEETQGVVPYLRAWLFQEDRPDLLDDFDEKSREYFPDL